MTPKEEIEAIRERLCELRAELAEDGGFDPDIKRTADDIEYLLAIADELEWTEMFDRILNRRPRRETEH